MLKKWLNRAPLGLILLVVTIGACVSGIGPFGEATRASESCPSAAGPDIIVGDIWDVRQWGTVDGVTGYSIATDSCNVGDDVIQFQRLTSEHPLIAQHIYRLKDGRIEQIGMSWVKHAFGAATLNTCCVCQNPGDGALLGVGCSDPYSASTNGDQDGLGGGTFGGLGRRSDVDPWTGVFPFPYPTQGESGDAVFKRMQVRNDDMDPVLNEGASYFVESQYIAPDDSLAGNQSNNASYRPISIGDLQEGGFAFDLSGSTAREKPAIEAWRDCDPDVDIQTVQVPDEGQFRLAYLATENGDGTWHYEYALYNMNSDRAAGRLFLAITEGVNVSNIGFGDVDYHSGEIYDGTDWESFGPEGGSLSWSTVSFDENPDANALRWGTTYNFRFDADGPPIESKATIGLFKPGTPSSVEVTAVVPSLAGGDGDCDGDNDVDLRDFGHFQLCFAGPGTPVSKACRCADFNGDEDVDLIDFGAFQKAFTGPR
jgi:hypothetical protein